MQRIMNCFAFAGKFQLNLYFLCKNMDNRKLLRLLKGIKRILIALFCVCYNNEKKKKRTLRT